MLLNLHLRNTFIFTPKIIC